MSTDTCRGGGAPSSIFACEFRHLVVLAFLGAAVCVGGLWAGPNPTKVPVTEDPIPGSATGNPPLKHRFTVVETDIGHLRDSGLRSQVEVSIRNDGEQIWSPDRRVRVSYQWRRVGEERWRRGVRTALPRAVAPGTTIDLAARVLTPEAPGLYFFQWNMIEENVGWFSKTDPTAAPEHFVVVVPFQTLPFALLLIAMVTLALIALRRKRSGKPLPAFIPPETDLYWLVVALVLKQHWVLASSGWSSNVRGVLATVATSVGVALALLLVSQRVRPWIAWGVNAGLSLIMCADVVYLRFFHDLPSFAVFGAVEQTGQVT